MQKSTGNKMSRFSIKIRSVTVPCRAILDTEPKEKLVTSILF